MVQFAIMITSQLGFYPPFIFSILVHCARESKWDYLLQHLFYILV